MRCFLTSQRTHGHQQLSAYVHEGNVDLTDGGGGELGSLDKEGSVVGQQVVVLGHTCGEGPYLEHGGAYPTTLRTALKSSIELDIVIYLL